MGKEYDVITLGEILLRLSAPFNERIVQSDSFQKDVGGAELNVATGISLLGLKTAVISKIPSSTIGSYVQNQINFYGVSDEYIIADDSKDSRMGIYYYEYGAYPRKPRVVYDRKLSSINSIHIDEIPEDIYQKTRLFHTSGITLGLGGNTRAMAIEMMKKFKENGVVISFDVNFRGNLWTGEEARACIEELMPYIDIFFCSEDTARLTFGKTGTLKEIQKSFCEEYPISIVASTERTVISPKEHNFTSVIYSAKEDKYFEEEAYEKIDVVDRIGSGDAYVAGALYGWLKYNDCQKALVYGNATSAVKNTVVGDMPTSNLDEIDQIIAQHNDTSEIKLEMSR